TILPRRRSRCVPNRTGSSSARRLASMPFPRNMSPLQFASASRPWSRELTEGYRIGRCDIRRGTPIFIIGAPWHWSWKFRVGRYRVRGLRGCGEMKFGIDRLIEEPELRRPLAGKKVAVLAHPASVTRDLVHSLDALAALGDIKIVSAFGP